MYRTVLKMIVKLIFILCPPYFVQSKNVLLIIADDAGLEVNSWKVKIYSMQIEYQIYKNDFLILHCPRLGPWGTRLWRPLTWTSWPKQARSSAMHTPQVWFPLLKTQSQSSPSSIKSRVLSLPNVFSSITEAQRMKLCYSYTHMLVISPCVWICLGFTVWLKISP